MSVAPSRLAIVAAVALAGCDPLVGVHATITAPPEALDAYEGPYPAQVVVTDDRDTHEIGAKPHGHRLAILCKKGEPLPALRYDRGGIGCAVETHLVAYVAPLPVDVAPTCGALAEPTFLDAPPPLAKPSGKATLFAGKDACGNYEESAAITLAP